MTMSKSNKFFVTGTDTEVGKTFISCALLEKAKAQGLTTGALKPVAAGCVEQDGILKNEDALALIDSMTLSLPYQSVNPVALKEAIAPHLAASHENKVLQTSRLTGFIQGAFMNRADLWLVEGAGGWFVPLNPRETLADIAIKLQLPVILVVAIRLGCINHALLTANAIRQAGLPIAGWVANCMDDNAECVQENIQSIYERIQAPLLGVVPKCENAQKASEYLSIEMLL